MSHSYEKQPEGNDHSLPTGGVSREYVRELRAAGFTSSTRREFLKRSAGAGVGLVAGAGLLSLAGCSSQGASVSLDEAETPELTIGFVPINCATPIIMADPLGIYEQYGLNVTVLKFGGWAEIRDAAIAGEIDAAHLLAPIPLALAMGIGPADAIPMRLAAIENVNGQAITLANRHLGNVEGPQDMRGMVFGIPFEFSMHNLLLRAYLAEGGLDPDNDVQLVVMRPPDMVAQLSVGNIDGFLGPEPVNQRAVYAGAGYIHELSRDMWDGHQCCSFSVRQQFIDENPRTYQALLSAIVDATEYSQNIDNRAEIAGAISPTEYLNQPVEVVEAAMTGHFDNGKGEMVTEPGRMGFDPYPWKSFALWMQTQLVRWGYITRSEVEDLGMRNLADEVFLTEGVRETQRELGLPVTNEEYREEIIFGRTFDPANPTPWMQKDIGARL